MDTDGTTGETGRWLSYAELAEVRGITRKAAARLTLRHHWRRQPGNDGATRVWVPEAELPHRQDPRQTPRQGAVDAVETPDMTGELTAANARVDAAIALADRLLTQLTEAQTAVTHERRRADELRDRLGLSQAALDQAQADARAARGEADAVKAADAARQARGLLARLRAAVRGR